MKKLTIFFISIVLCMVFVMQPTQCFAAVYGNCLEPGELICKGQYLTSNNNKYKLVMQESDGNLVLYNKTNGRALWASNTINVRAFRCCMQDDGNLVIYDEEMHHYAPPFWTPLWSTRTHSNPGARLVLQDDGNLVMYKGSKAIWATNTCGK